MSLEELVFGVHAAPEVRSFQEIRDRCLQAEKLGFDLFTITDHFMNMRQPDGPDRHPMECWSTLAGLAAITNRIRLGPLVSCYYYRQPTVLAKMATTIDIISNGRLVFGVGAGWHQKEFEGFFGRFPPVKERMSGLEETVQICCSMFTNERTTFKGRLYHIESALNSPLPVQRPPPIMVGGGGEKKTLRIAAKYADISHCAFNPSEEELNRKLTALRKHCESVGRDYNEIKKGMSLFPIIGFTSEEIDAKIKQRAQRAGIDVDEYKKRLGPVTGTLEHCIEAIREYIEKGVSLFTLGFFDSEDTKFFAENVLPKLR